MEQSLSSSLTSPLLLVVLVLLLLLVLLLEQREERESLGWVKLALVGDTGLASSRVGLCVGEKRKWLRRKSERGKASSCTLLHFAPALCSQPLLKFSLRVWTGQTSHRKNHLTLRWWRNSVAPGSSTFSFFSLSLSLFLTLIPSLNCLAGM